MLDASVVVCTKNAEFNLEECLKSIRENEPREIILVDGHSTDSTIEIAGKYTDVIVYDPGKGIAAARNIGIDHASSRYICFVGPDNIMPPGSILKCISCLEENKYAGVSPLTLIADPGKSYIAWALNAHRKARFHPGERDVIGTPYLFRAEVLKKTRFDPQLDSSDDSDLCARLKSDGFTVGIADILVYESGCESMSSIIQRWSWYGKSDFEYYSKYSPGWGIKRKIYSVTHPLRDELILPFCRAPWRERFLLLPFLILITSVRYVSWIRHVMRS